MSVGSGPARFWWLSSAEPMDRQRQYCMLRCAAVVLKSGCMRGGFRSVQVLISRADTRPHGTDVPIPTRQALTACAADCPCVSRACLCAMGCD